MRLILLLIILPATGLAQIEVGSPWSDGILSYIEDAPDPRAAFQEEILRGTPFVEIIDAVKFRECERLGFDQDQCPKFEYSIPFIPEEEAYEVEYAIAYEWFRFETRSYNRTLMEIGAIDTLLTCGALAPINSGYPDFFWLLMTGELIFPAKEICDGISIEVLPRCSQCYLPLESCPNVTQSCKECVQSGIVSAKAHSEVYRVDMHLKVFEAVLTHMPTALHYGKWFLPDQGALVQPVSGVTFPSERLNALIQDAVAKGIDLRAAIYFLQSGARYTYCTPPLPRAAISILELYPAIENEENTPGIQALEVFKRDLSDREDAGNIHKRHGLAILLGLDTLVTQWDSQGYIFSDNKAINGTTAPLLYSCYGFATLFQIFTMNEVIVAPHRQYSRPALCNNGFKLVPYPPFIIPDIQVTQYPLIPTSWFSFGPRHHTAWSSVPEGYDIPHVKGVPEWPLPLSVPTF